MAAGKQKGLGRGLGALLSTNAVEQTKQSAEMFNVKQSTNLPEGTVVTLPIDEVYPNHEQPRQYFDKEKLESLAESIREVGVIIPIIVTKTESGYQIVAGERRWRASKLAEKATIPAIIRELNELEILQQALIENIQRQDLNPLEEAASLKKLTEEYSMRQEEISNIVGRSRSAIANTMRLLNLSDPVKQMLLAEEISAGHARALLSITDDQKQYEIAGQVRNRGLSVRQTEQLVKQILEPPAKPAPIQGVVTDPIALSIKEVENRCTKALGTKVKLKDKNNKGTLIIEYYSHDELDRIIELFEAAGTNNN